MNSILGPKLEGIKLMSEINANLKRSISPNIHQNSNTANIKANPSQFRTYKNENDLALKIGSNDYENNNSLFLKVSGNDNQQTNSLGSLKMVSPNNNENNSVKIGSEFMISKALQKIQKLITNVDSFCNQMNQRIGTLLISQIENEKK